MPITSLTCSPSPALENHPMVLKEMELANRKPSCGTPLKRAKQLLSIAKANFGDIDGKTANGLVRYSEKYEILSVIDSEQAGRDAGVVLGNPPNGIPICRDLDDALARADSLAR